VVRALSALGWPQTLVRDQGSSALVETSLLRAALAPAIPALRACVGKQTSAAYRVTIVKNGPRSPDAPDRTRYAMPAPGASADLAIDVDDAAPTPTATIDATRACLRPIAERIALPIPKDRDTWYRVELVVIAP
jgi:hypothetical protein